MRRRIYEADHEAFRGSVRTFLDRHVWPRVDEFIEAHAFPRDLWLEAGRQGLLGLSVPEEVGGEGAEDFRFNAVLTEELSRVNAALPSAFGIHTDIVAPYLVELSHPEVRQQWLAKFVTGEMLTALAMTEPGGGSDVAAIRTTAVRDGDDWVINGSKTFITNGFSADLVVVAASTTPSRGAKGISLFGVEATTPGFSRGRKLDKVGQPEADTAELFFEDVRVPVTHLIGEPDRGFIHMMERLPKERLNAAVANIAHAAQILTETINYTRERRAFGSAIGSLQHNKFLLADLVTRVDVTTHYVDQCIIADVEGDLSPVDAAKAKWWSAEVQGQVLDACVQLWGGVGFMNEYRVARAWRDARVTRIWAGSNEIMKEIIGRDLGL